MAFRDNLEAAHQRLAETEEETEALREELEAARLENVRIREALAEEKATNRRVVERIALRSAPTRATETGPRARKSLALKLGTVVAAIAVFGAAQLGTRPKAARRPPIPAEQIASALRAVQTDACGAASAEGHVSVAFNGTGQATTVHIEGAAASAVACLMAKYQMVRIPPFSNESGTISVGTKIRVPE